MSDTHDSSPTPGNSPIPAALTARWHRHLAKVEKALDRLDVDLLGSGAEADVLRAALDDLLAASREIETVERLVTQRLCDAGDPAAPRRRTVATERRALVGAGAPLIRRAARRAPKTITPSGKLSKGPSTLCRADSRRYRGAMGYLRACYRLPLMLAGSVVSTTASGRLCAMGARLRLNLARA